MKIEGEYTFGAPRQQVWDLLQDPAALSRALPGVERFEQVGPREYEATIRAGVAAVRGTYHGRIRMADLQPPERYALIANGQGSTGTFEATAQIVLAEQDGRTQLRYDADAQVGGAVAGVGQRMLGGVAKLMANQFFKALEGQLGGQATGPIGRATARTGSRTDAASPSPSPSPAPSSSAPAGGSAPSGAGLLDLVGMAGPAAPAVAVGMAGLALGFLFGRGSRPSGARAPFGEYELAAAMRDLASAIREQRRR